MILAMALHFNGISFIQNWFQRRHHICALLLIII